MAAGSKTRRVVTSARFGPLHPGFEIEIDEGYSSLIGPNNTGKSAILQLAFRVLYDDPEFGANRIVLIPADRATLPTTLEVAGRSLTDANDSYMSSLRGETIWPHDGSRGLPAGELSRLLMTHTNLIKQINSVDAYLAELGLPPIVIQGAQQLHFEDVQAHFQGSGLRALLPILAAISDKGLRAILIDEPEASLEPTVARGLRDLLLREAGGRILLVATQSHLLIDRSDKSSVRIVSRKAGETTVRNVVDDSDLLDLVYRLLGNNTQDLLLPGNFMVVEGGSDQTIVERALDLTGASTGAVKVIAAGGISKVEVTAAAIETMVRPITTGDSPYAKLLVVIVDRAVTSDNKATADSLRKTLGSRFVELPASSLEEYLPDALYAKAGLSKETELINLAAVRSDHSALQARKAELARAIAQAMTKADLDLIPEIRDASQLASARKEPPSPTRAGRDLS